VSQVLSKLEVQHFIKRESNPNNHREFFFVLAEEGLAYQALIEESDEEFVNVLKTMKKVKHLFQSP
jgi:DNA-binding MarR family transcriptional regulator